METKKSLTSYTYKQLSRNNMGWKTTYIVERPWEEMAVDVDSLVFFYMRRYISIPYRSRKDEVMVSAAFIRNVKQSTTWVVEDVAQYCIKQLILLLKYLRSLDLTLHPVCSIGYPKLKRDLRDERLLKRKEMETSFSRMGRDDVMESIGKYILGLRDDVRDLVVEHEELKKHLHYSIEADKWCGRNHRVIMTEDVDVFLFGNKKTIIVKPFLLVNAPTTFRFIDCKSYFMNKGIATYDNFIQVSFMMGTDYNYGIKGMGPKKAVNAINKYGTVAKYVGVKYDIVDEQADVLMKRYKRFMDYVTS